MTTPQAAASLAGITVVKGDSSAVAEFKKGTVYVVEYWATWCPPCRTSIPHLSELQNKFRDQGVVFIGISNESTETVKKFAEQMGDQMDYIVAADPSRSIKGYMEAYGVRGIPHAFLVDKQGKVVWHGHPMEPSFEKMIAQQVQA